MASKDTSDSAQEQLSARVKNIIHNIRYITLATVSTDGKPWNAPVFFAYNGDHHIYWGSPADSRHSQNIRANGEGYIVIYDSTVTPGTGEGVYMRAHCGEISDPDEMAIAYELLIKRRGPIPYWDFDDFNQEKPIRLYKAVPIEVSTNDEFTVDGVIIDQRTKVEL